MNAFICIWTRILLIRYGQLRTLRMRYGPVTDKTDMDAPYVASAESVNMCVTGTKLLHVTLTDSRLLSSHIIK